MAKLLAIFNLIASALSIIGFAVSLQMGRTHPVVVVTFIVTLALTLLMSCVSRIIAHNKSLDARGSVLRKIIGPAMLE